MCRIIHICICRCVYIVCCLLHIRCILEIYLHVLYVHIIWLVCICTYIHMRFKCMYYIQGGIIMYAKYISTYVCMYTHIYLYMQTHKCIVNVYVDGDIAFLQYICKLYYFVPQKYQIYFHSFSHRRTDEDDNKSICRIC